MRPHFASFALLLLASVVSLSLASSISAGVASPGEWVVFAAATASAVGGAIAAGRRDSYAFAVFAALLSVICGAGGALVSAVSENRSRGALALEVCGGLGLVVSLLYLVWTQSRRDGVPNLLRERFPRRAIFERNGVQFTATAPSVLLPSDVIVPLEVFLQNCTDEERRVDVAFSHGGFFAPAPTLMWRSPGTVVLQPAEVKSVTLPLATRVARAGSASIYVTPRVFGTPGRRVRTWRVQQGSEPTPLWQVVLALLVLAPVGALLVWTAGVRLRFQLLPGSVVRGESELPEPTVITLWPKAA